MGVAIYKPKYVWWDLDCLHVPRGGDPYEYRWIIESALNKKFGDGPITIFAIGNLNRIPLPVLELILRARIVMKHTTEEAMGHTIILTCVNQKPDSPKYASDVWLWKSLVTDTEKETPVPRLQAPQGKCCETDWECLECWFQGQGFTDYTKHLKNSDHLLWEWLTLHPNASVEPTDEDLDSLHSQLMTNVVKQSKPRPRRKPKANPMMVKVHSEPHKDFESYKVAFRQAHDCQVGHQDL